MILDTIKRNRSYRRFDASHRITRDDLEKIVEAARYSPSAANLQTLRFYLVSEPQACDATFLHLRWAGYLKYWDGPSPSEQPTAYVLLMGPDACSKFHHIDGGIAAQSMLLKATEMGLGGCMIASFDKDGLANALDLPQGYEICLVIALGKPDEKVVLEDVTDPDDIEYYRDAEDVHHVPKRLLSDLIVN